MLKIETLSDMVQQLIADRDEHKRKAAISHELAEMSRRQVVEMAEKIQYLIDRLAPTIRSREQE
jgi:macrodomain Ter protein organizer (MatP/YcbG family)